MHCILSPIINNQIKSYINDRGYVIVETKGIKSIDTSLRFHPDIQAFCCGNTLFVTTESYSHYSKYCGNIISCDSILNAVYPNDIALNCFLTNNNIFCKKTKTDKKIIDFCLKQNIEIINTNQGYSNCSALYLKDNGVITSDLGMMDMFIENGYDVLLIDNSQIELKDFSHGFIGGSACKIGDEIIFFGNIEAHKDFIRIKVFLDKYNLSYKKFNFPMQDYGGAIFF